MFASKLCSMSEERSRRLNQLNQVNPASLFEKTPEEIQSFLKMVNNDNPSPLSPEAQILRSNAFSGTEVSPLDNRLNSPWSNCGNSNRIREVSSHPLLPEASQASSHSSSSSEEEIFLSSVSSYRAELSKHLAISLNRRFLSDLKAMNFQTPCSQILKAKSRASTEADEPSEEVQINLTDAVKRINKVNELLLQFEEKCYINKVISESQLRTLRSKNRGVLGKVLDTIILFKHHHVANIAINILMLNSSKIKIPKNTFKALISQTFKRTSGREFTIYSAKQSKTHALLKAVVKLQH